jgi:hypothetical protein
MSSKTKTVKAKQPVKSATPAKPAAPVKPAALVKSAVPTKPAVPTAKPAVPPATAKMEHQSVTRFSVKSGTVVDDIRGNFVKFSDFKAISEKNLKLSKAILALENSYAKASKTCAQMVQSDAKAVAIAAIEAVNVIDEYNPKKEKIVAKLIKACANLGIEIVKDNSKS